MEKLRLGIVGLGQRGKGMLSTFLAYSAVDVVAICDVYEDRVEEFANTIHEKRGYYPHKYHRHYHPSYQPMYRHRQRNRLQNERYPFSSYC